jgi:hypothetical protein
MTPEREARIIKISIHGEQEEGDFEFAILTKEELEEGWHYCNDWDGLLVGPEDDEMQCCTCFSDLCLNEKCFCHKKAALKAYTWLVDTKDDDAPLTSQREQERITSWGLVYAATNTCQDNP